MKIDEKRTNLLPSLAPRVQIPGRCDARRMCAATSDINHGHAAQRFDQFRPVIGESISMTEFAFFTFAPRVN